MKRLLLSSLALFALAIPAQAQECPAVTVADPMGITAGDFPQQYELSEFQEAANCTLTFQENPAIGDLNAQIRGNPALPPLAERLAELPRPRRRSARPSPSPTRWVSPPATSRSSTSCPSSRRRPTAR